MAVEGGRAADGTPAWVTIAEAVFLTGRSEEDIRARVESGEVPSRPAAKGSPVLLVSTANLPPAEPQEMAEDRSSDQWLVVVRRDSRRLDLLPHLRR